MKQIKWLVIVSFMAFLVLGRLPSTNASTITITPDTEEKWEHKAGDLTNPQAGDIPDLVGYEGTVSELYKQDVGKADVGPFASSYETTFTKTETDPEDAKIKWVNGTDYISGDPLYLLVKDGNHDPWWYIFNLRNLDLDGHGTPESQWNGTDTIFLDGFWPNQGAISHVALYGVHAPVPPTIVLLGTGLIGLVGISRKKFEN